MLKQSFFLVAVACASLSSAALAQTAQTPAAPAASAPKLVPRAAGDVPPPEHPATPEQIREYLDLTKSAENAHHAFGQLVASSKAQAPPTFPADFWQDLSTSFNSIDVVTQLTPVYQRYFSQEDMAAALAFYKTSAGRHVLADQPLAAVAAGDVLRREGQRVGQETYTRHKAEIEASQKPAPPALSSPSDTTKPSSSSPSEKPTGQQPQPQPQR